MKYILSSLLLITTFSLFAQREHHIDLTYSSGNSINSLSGHIVKNFKLLPSEKLLLGVGARGSYVFGKSTEYLTAPAKHNKSSDGIDTIVTAKPQFFNINVSLNAAYHFNSKFAIGANLDLGGFSFGFKRDADYYPSLDAQNESDPRTALKNEEVKPQRNNLFLTGKNSKGSLFSEVFMRYTPIERVSIRAGYSYIITEYASSNRIGHNNNYRFRNTSGGFLIGLSWNFI